MPTWAQIIALCHNKVAGSDYLSGHNKVGQMQLGPQIHFIHAIQVGRDRSYPCLQVAKFALAQNHHAP